MFPRELLGFKQLLGATNTNFLGGPAKGPHVTYAFPKRSAKRLPFFYLVLVYTFI